MSSAYHYSSAASLKNNSIYHKENVTLLNCLRAYLRLLCIATYPSVITAVMVLSSHDGFKMWYRMPVSVVYNMLLFSVGILLISLFPAFLARLIVRSAIAISIVFLIFSTLHFAQYSQLVGLPSVHAVIDTTWQEAREYVLSATRALPVTSLLIALLATAPLVAAFAQCPTMPTPFFLARFKYSAGAVGVLALVAIGFLGTTRSYLWQNNQLMLMIGSTTQALIETHEVKKLLESTVGGPPPHVVLENSKPATHILILGESTTRKHMSLYGYGRETSPQLTRLAPELEIATNACSSRGQTAEQMKELFTFATREDPTLLTKGPSLTQLMKAGGFKVYWLSNQQIVGELDRWAGIFSMHADERHMVNKRGWSDGVSYDEQLLPILREIMAGGSDQQRFIVVHLLGTHQGYDLRYPGEFQKFEGLDGADHRFLAHGHTSWGVRSYNAYDDAVLYNDYIVSEIIRAAKASDRATVTYLSDHGESVGEGNQMFGHIEGPAPRQVYEIPLLFYLSPTFKKENGNKLEVLRSNLQRPIQSDELIHTLLDIYGVGHPLRRSDRSLLSVNFETKPRYCDTPQ